MRKLRAVSLNSLTKTLPYAGPFLASTLHAERLLTLLGNDSTRLQKAASINAQSLSSQASSAFVSSSSDTSPPFSLC